VVENAKEGYWITKNGYCLPRVDGSIARLSTRLSEDKNLEDRVRESVQVGIHWETEVWGAAHKVTQVLCSALPVGCLKHVKSAEWQVFASVVLEAMFDATLTAAACLAAQRGERVKVFLTALGGGELSNRVQWIAAAMTRALEIHAQEPLDVALVHYTETKCQDFLLLEEGRRPQVPVTPKLRRSPTTPSLGLTAKLAEMEIEKPDDETAAAMRKAFAKFDTNGDGVLDRAEFVAMLNSIDEDFFTPHVINILLDEADSDNDGRIYYHEWVGWICQEDEDIVKKLLGIADED